MKITLNKLNELKEAVKLSWIARASGWDRGSMYKYMQRRQDMTSTPESVSRLRKILKALRLLRSELGRVIRYYEDMLIALDNSGVSPEK